MATEIKRPSKVDYRAESEHIQSTNLRRALFTANNNITRDACSYNSQIKLNQITVLAKAPVIRSTGAQVQAYNYNANTIIPINNKSKKLKNPQCR